jgi:Protein of unknown function (DUF2384)
VYLDAESVSDVLEAVDVRAELARVVGDLALSETGDLGLGDAVFALVGYHGSPVRSMAMMPLGCLSRVGGLRPGPTDDYCLHDEPDRSLDRAICPHEAPGTVMEPSSVDVWLRQPMAALEGRKPIDLIASGEYVPVAALISALEESPFS